MKEQKFIEIDVTILTDEECMKLSGRIYEFLLNTKIDDIWLTEYSKEHGRQVLWEVGTPYAKAVLKNSTLKQCPTCGCDFDGNVCWICTKFK